MTIFPPLATVLLDPPTALLFGCALAMVSTRLLRKNPEAELARTVKLGAAWAVFYGLCVAYFYFVYPDWMFAYLKDARETPLVPTYVAFVAILAAFGAIGAAATATMIVRGRQGWALLFTVGAALTLGMTFYLQGRQYMLLGTYAEYRANEAVPLQSVAAMRLAFNVSGIASGLGAVALFLAQMKRAQAAARSR